jgi:hypothetical protein
MVISPTKLRSNLYRVLDEVLRTGLPVEVERRGKRLRISPVEPASKLAKLKSKPKAIVGDPEDLVHIDWSSEWKP